MSTVNGSSVVYAYEGNDVLYEKNMTTGAVTDHFYVGRLQLAKLSSSVPYYYHFDALGSIRLVTDFGGINAFSTNYLPYGIAYNTTGMETFMYTDKPVDASTGLYYFGARFYDVTLFRFMSRDTDFGSLNDPPSLNLYVYARDNPQRYVDTNGHKDIDGWVEPRTQSQPKMGLKDWLIVYLSSKSVINDLISGVGSTILAALCPAIEAVLGGVNHIFAAMAGVAITNIMLDLPTLASAIMKNDLASFCGAAGQLAMDVFYAFMNQLSWKEWMEVATIECGWIIGSGGLGLALTATAVIATTALWALPFFYKMWAAWDTYNNE